jgi:Arylsulfotransferase (ASST)
MWFAFACATSIPLEEDKDSETVVVPWPEAPLAEVSIAQDDDIGSVMWVTWTQEVAADAWVEWSLDGEPVQTTPLTARAPGTHSQIVLGIPYDQSFTWQVKLSDGVQSAASELGTAQTGTLPSRFPEPTVLVADETRYDADHPYLFGSINGNDNGWGGPNAHLFVFVLDRAGRVVWAMETPDGDYTMYAQPAADGVGFFWDQATYWTQWDGGNDSVVHRSLLDGTLVESFETPGLHHSFLGLPDGRLLWGAADDVDESLMVRNPDGSTEELWRCSDDFGPLGGRDYCQSNSMWYDAATETALFSFYSLETIFELDLGGGGLLRYWGKEQEDWRFDPEDSQFQWQHGPMWTEEGTLLVSSLRGEDERNREMVAYEYVLDEGAKTLTPIHIFGAGDDISSDTNGEARRLPNGNTLHNMGDAGRIREWTADEEVVWDIEFGRGHLLGHTTLLTELYSLAP